MHIYDELVLKIGAELKKQPNTLTELVNIAEREMVSFSTIVMVEAMARENKTREQVYQDSMAQFEHNLKALELGIKNGKSFLLGEIGSELSQKRCFSR